MGVVRKYLPTICVISVLKYGLDIQKHATVIFWFYNGVETKGEGCSHINPGAHIEITAANCELQDKVMEGAKRMKREWLKNNVPESVKNMLNI